jgi:hypothetical protein
MKNEIKEIIAERIKYHSNKQKYGYFIGNDCIDICASDILDDVIKAGYSKQSETVKEFAEKVKFGMAQFGYYYCGSNGVEYFGDIQVNDFAKMINNLAEQYGKEE